VLQGKPVAVVSASPSPSGAARAQVEVCMVLAAPGAQVIDAGLVLASAHEQFDGLGRLGSDAHRCGLSRLLEQLALAAVPIDPVARAA
jgi:NAD(P)H-dependent FMN reductase